MTCIPDVEFPIWIPINGLTCYGTASSFVCSVKNNHDGTIFSLIHSSSPSSQSAKSRPADILPVPSPNEIGPKQDWDEEVVPIHTISDTYLRTLSLTFGTYPVMTSFNDPIWKSRNEAHFVSTFIPAYMPFVLMAVLSSSPSPPSRVRVSSPVTHYFSSDRSNYARYLRPLCSR
jgi:hypothetical protein